MVWSLFAATAIALLLVYQHVTYVSRRVKTCPMPPKADSSKQDFLPKKKNRILVTGGCGGVGRKLVNILLQENADFVGHIIVFDQIVPTTKHEDPRVTYTQGDITKLESVVAATSGCDIVFHLASFIDLRSKARHWPRIYNINVVGAHNVVEACVQNGVPALVYTGSCSSRIDCDSVIKYGDKFRVCENAEGKNNIFDFPEEECISHYGKTKALAERAVISANERGLLRTAAILPCVVFGHQDRFWFDWILDKCLKVKKPNVLLQSREKGDSLSYTYNDSTARLHISCARALVDPEKRDNIGGQSFYSVDFDGERWGFLDEVEDSLVKASKGQYERVGFYSMNTTLIKILSFVANAIDWFYDGNVKDDFFQLGAHYAVVGYGSGNLCCDGTKAQKLLNFQPYPRKAAMEETAQKYFIN